MINIHTGIQRKTIVVTFIMIVMMMVFVSCNKVEKNDVKVQNTAFSMGTSFTSTLYGKDQESLEKELISIEQLLTEIDTEISWRNEGSLVSIFNEERKVSVGEHGRLFQTALEVAEKSQGAFDPTVLSVSELWGIGTENQRHPEDTEITEALMHVDYNALTLEDDILSSEHPEVLFELGAIGKGYALDLIQERMDREQITGGILNAGSSITAFGTKPDGDVFRVGLRDPRGAQEDLIGIFELTDISISTSGDYEKYFEEDGKRYHHILDARTGYPADSGLMQVTVIDENSTLCDALSTAGFILGLKDGMELMEYYGVMAIFVDNQRNVYYNNKSVLDILEFDGESSGYILTPYEGE